MASLLQPGLNGAFLAEGFGDGPAVAHRSELLAGLRLAVKDVFAVEGLRTGAGNPLWHAQQAPARASAHAVQWLLEAGARWVGKTVTDELAFGLAGVNAHYGTPINPAAPKRIAGGSSSGSVVAVAAGDVDIGLGSDCGGSCRLPASYCGVWGFRPTQGLVAKNGGFSLAHSFDTVGWFTRTGAQMAAVFAALTGTEVSTPLSRAVNLLTVQDVAPWCDAPVRTAFEALPKQLGDALFRIAAVPAGTLPLADWAQAHRTLQAAEIWQQHGAWVRAHGQSLGEDVRQRFEAAACIAPAQVAAEQPVRAAAASRIATLLADDALLLLPTVPTAAPALDAPREAVDTIRARSQALLCIAGLAGLPQTSLPWIAVDGAPVGLSLIGPRHADALVLAAAQAVQAHLS